MRNSPVIGTTLKTNCRYLTTIDRFTFDDILRTAYGGAVHGIDAMTRPSVWKHNPVLPTHPLVHAW